MIEAAQEVRRDQNPPAAVATASSAYVDTAVAVTVTIHLLDLGISRNRSSG